MAIHREIEALRTVWFDSVVAITELGMSLSDQEWEASTPCPGWSRKDLISHLVGLESRVLGSNEPVPVDLDLAKPWVKNEIAGFMEIDVEVRRPRRGSIVLGEFRDITTLRNEFWLLDSRSPESLVTFEPFGEISLKLLLERRTMDMWVHEQDLRTSLRIPGNETNPGALHTAKLLGQRLPSIFVKKCAARPGMSLSLEVRGAFATHIEVDSDGKGRIVDVATAPTVTISLSPHEWYLLVAGRDGRENCQPLISGDELLARTLLENFSATP